MSICSLPTRRRAWLAALSGLLIAGAAISPALAHLLPAALGTDAGGGPPAHLVISEVMTGGTGASDEFVELYNPTAGPLLLDGLELVYVSASGATVTRKASWDAGAQEVPAHAHVLLANEAGAYAAMADLTYANGMAAAGGSVALRIAADASPVDAVGWGTATAWLEGGAAPAPAAGESLERLPGGSLGSGQDTDDNATDCVVNPVPDPQNVAADPVPPSASPAPSGTPSSSPEATPAATPTTTSSPTASATPSSTPTATPTPTPAPTSSSGPAPLAIAEARALPDGSEARISGISLMDAGFADGGACVTDGSAGIAVLADGATFARGDRIDAVGTVEDRYAQRTLRVGADGLGVEGASTEPEPVTAATGDVGEAFECRLVAVSGAIQGAPSTLSSGLAFEIDDGTGAVRVLVAAGSGIETTSWLRGAWLTVVGVVGQRDSSGTGAAGYRVQPRDPGDVRALEPSASPSPTPSGSPAPSGSASPSPSVPADLVTIAAARAAAPGDHLRVRGVVTLPNGLVDDPTAVIQDASGAIVLRMGDDAGTLRRGTLVEVVGTRSTKSGMATIRSDEPPLVLGMQDEPAARAGMTGGLGEAQEALLVIVRGVVTSAPSRSTAGNAAFTVDDGSGPLRVTLFAAAGLPDALVAKGDSVEIAGVLGQVTTGSLPTRGYRIWPRSAGDLRVVTPAASAAGQSADGPASGAHGAPSRPKATATAPRSPAVRGGSLAVRPRTGTGTGGAIAASGPVGPPGSSREVVLAAAHLSSARLALLLLGAALCVALGAIGWRSGAFERLGVMARTALTGAGDGGDGGDGDG